MRTRIPALLAAPPAAAGRLYLAHARLFDGTGAPPRDAAAVLVEDGRIARVGSASDAAFRGPRLLTCGKIISATAPGGRFYGTMYREADGPDDVRKAVREQIRMGADFVKVMTTGARSNELEDPEPTQLTDAELAALVDEAHRLGYRVAAHAEGNAGAEAAIAHGMDTIEHGMYLNQRPELL